MTSVQLGDRAETIPGTSAGDLGSRPLTFSSDDGESVISVDWRGQGWRVTRATDEEALTILRSAMSAAALSACLRILWAARHIKAFEEFTCPTDDGGMTLEFSDPATRRDIIFAIPGDGSIRYFVARGEAGFRRAGIIIAEGGVPDLARWCAGEAAELDYSRLAVGESSVSRR